MKRLTEVRRKARHSRIREKVVGTSQRPRLVVHRSLKNLQVQLVDDEQARTIFSMSTTAKELKEKIPYGGNAKAAEIFGEVLAKQIMNKGVKSVVFDRGGYIYHGRVRALAEALRKGGLTF